MLSENSALLTQEDVANIFGVTVHAVRKWRRYHQIPYIRIGQTIRFDPEDVWIWALEHRQAAVPKNQPPVEATA